MISLLLERFNGIQADISWKLCAKLSEPIVTLNMKYRFTGLEKCAMSENYSFAFDYSVTTNGDFKIIVSTLTMDFPEKSSIPSSQAYTNLDTSSGRLINHHSRTLHMVYPKISRGILVATL